MCMFRPLNAVCDEVAAMSAVFSPSSVTLNELVDGMGNDRGLFLALELYGFEIVPPIIEPNGELVPSVLENGKIYGVTQHHEARNTPVIIPQF